MAIKVSNDAQAVCQLILNRIRTEIDPNISDDIISRKIISRVKRIIEEEAKLYP